MSDANKKPFENVIRRGETVTKGWGYLSQVRRHERAGQDPLFFASIGLQCGWKPGENPEKPDPIFQNVELLIGSTCVRSMMALEGEHTKESGLIYGYFVIRNLNWSVAPVDEGKAYLNSRGILETVQFGWIDE